MDFHVHCHAGHIRDGNDGLPFPHRRAFADGFLPAPIVVASTAVNHQAAFLGVDGAFLQLLTQVVALPGLDLELALRGAQPRIRLGQFRDGQAPGFVQVAHGVNKLGERFFGGLGEVVFQKKTARGFGGLDFEPAVVVGDFIPLQIILGDESLFKQPAGAFQRGGGLAEFLLRDLEIVVELA
ncbi:MAG: hypothetical protein BWX84_01662 [Verrucomicrobia bacterium ADurb.Bin118]|nr:MAG: hypothetical protein BWX84_01662 [Verrucomicrobia bacterium ADurb.Bin118]